MAEKLNSTNPDKICSLIGQFSSLETITAVRDLMIRMGSENFVHSLYPFLGQQREDFYLNRSLQEIEFLDNLVLINFNPKLESPLLNA